MLPLDDFSENIRFAGKFDLGGVKIWFFELAHIQSKDRRRVSGRPISKEKTIERSSSNGIIIVGELRSVRGGPRNLRRVHGVCDTPIVGRDRG